MDEKFQQLDLAAMFHSLLFAYQKTLGDVMGTKATQALLPRVTSYLEKAGATTALGSIRSRNPEEALKQFGELLVRSGMVGEVSVHSAEGGFQFVVKHCMFAEHVHELLQPRDVTCPYALLAMFLVKKNTGREVEDSLSAFSKTDSHTPIKFVQEPDVLDHLREWAGVGNRGEA